MTRPTQHRNLLGLTIVVFILMVSGIVHADVIVDATVSPIPGGFHFEYSITNNELEDVAIVSIVGPVADLLIGPTLTAPVGFLPNYDSGLGFIDFIGDAASFVAGTTTVGFGFDSASSPGPTTFSALTILGDTLTGPTQAPVGVPVPEPATVTLLLVGMGALAGFRARISMRNR